MAGRREPWNPLLCSYPDSRKVNLLSFEAETLFTRLIARCDDAANYDANPTLMMCHLFSKRIESGQVTPKKVLAWRDELVRVGLVVLYSADGGEYLHINNCKKSLRNDIAKDFRYPEFTGESVIEVPEEPEQEQHESGPRSLRPRAVAVLTESVTKINTDEFVTYWNQFASLPAIQNMNSTRIKQLKTRAKEQTFAENWKAIIEKLSKSAFHTGENDRGWKANVDWIITNDTNYMKILEMPDVKNQTDKALGRGGKSLADVEKLEKECGL